MEKKERKRKALDVLAEKHKNSSHEVSHTLYSNFLGFIGFHQNIHIGIGSCYTFPKVALIEQVKEDVGIT